MGCLVFWLLPEIAKVARHLEGPKFEADLLTVARSVCRTCREGAPDGECPLGEKFGRTVRGYLPEICKVAARVSEKGGD